MNRAIQIATFVKLLAATAMYLLLCAGLWQARHVPLHADGVLTHAEAVESKVNASAVNLDKATGAWAAAAQGQAQSVQGFLAQANGTLTTMNTQLAHVGPLLDQAKATVAGLGKDSHRLTLDAGTVLGTADNSLRAARPVLAGAAQVETDLDRFVTAPELQATVANVQQTAANVAAGSAEATQILKDGRKEADAFIAPKPWYKRFPDYLLKGGELVWDFKR